MSILDAIREANQKTEGIETFLFARIDEKNAFFSSFDSAKYPLNLIIPFPINFRIDPPLFRATVPIQGWIVRRLDMESIDFRSDQVEEEYLAPMRKIAKQFINHLVNSDIVDIDVEEVTGTILPEYRIMNDSLFGVSYTLNLPIISKVC
jgi:hypothetical protein